VADAPVVNASPLIYLSRGGRMEFLRMIGEEVVVPRSVADEIRRHGESDVTARALAEQAWIRVVPDLPIPASIQSWDLGRGESAVLAWALAHIGCEAIVDDLAARRCAAAIGVPVRGTLGLVLVAKRRGLIPSARSVVEELRSSGMYLSDDVINRAIALVDE
jgi:predicted nucleic acid-binding protein